jgi:hypothetical protein
MKWTSFAGGVKIKNNYQASTELSSMLAGQIEHKCS